ncbi:MAG: hypothetical protein Q8M22_10345 [Actinomycetota bacterium]|nr:hypothetical protein [Actinomycetota bacterium]
MIGTPIPSTAEHFIEEGIAVPTTTWTEAPTDTMTAEQVLERLSATGALDEIESVIEALETNTLDSQMASPDEVRRRVAKYCRH